MKGKPYWVRFRDGIVHEGALKVLKEIDGTYRFYTYAGDHEPLTATSEVTRLVAPGIDCLARVYKRESDSVEILIPDSEAY